ncbi:hypothetical protein QFC22_000488 [Naganishia vaughanmartiniae]|uniref:Uncharacterized protein n=1 Tax=Naganishia vaughanmartiniae TaxID=1424756 RepID=A0ACC2XNG9_9TREE|nr:hypothetical protein QFC22_000488 [Naganishia vaughanmartiniae]
MDRQHISAALSRVSDPSFDSVELFYASHPEWPAPRPVSQSTTLVEETQSHTASQKESPRKKIHIAVFDSSFNPPTKAHLAISLTSYPPRTSLASIPSTDTAKPNDSITAATAALEPDEPYTARLLLLSARNVDKTLKPGDATFPQRIEMMKLQALDMEDATAAVVDGSGSARNVAVAALNHPTFVGKSDILLRWLRDRFSPTTTSSSSTTTPESQQQQKPEIRLTFLIGTDTLLRLFIPKYYTPSPRLGSDMTCHLEKLFTTDGSDIVVANRGASKSAREEEEAFVRSQPSCADLVRSGKIRFVVEGEVGEAEREMSSTRVRRALMQGHEEEARSLMGQRVGEYVVREGLYTVL